MQCFSLITNNCFLICLIRYVYICFYYFLIFCSCFRRAKPVIDYFIHPPPHSPSPLYIIRCPMRAEEEVCAAEGCHNKALTKEGCESKLGTYLAPFVGTACYIQYFQMLHLPSFTYALSIDRDDLYSF